MSAVFSCPISFSLVGYMVTDVKFANIAFEM